MSIQTISFPSYDGVSIDIKLQTPNKPGKKALVIYFHPGGFFNGSIDDGFVWKWQSTINKLMDANIAYASVGYRLLVDNDPEGLRRPLYDCMAALQYLRHNSGTLKLKKNKIALLGGSAGATAAMWIAFNKNMQDLTITDPNDYRRQSTKVKAVAAFECQSSLDVTMWQSITFGGSISLQCIRTKISQPKLRGYYAASSITSDQELMDAVSSYESMVDAYNPAHGNIKLDHLSLLKKNAPPIWLESDQQPNTTTCSSMTNAKLLHHPMHPKAIYDRIVTVNSNGGNIGHVVRIPNLGIDVDSYGIYGSGTDVGDFLVNSLI